MKFKVFYSICIIVCLLYPFVYIVGQVTLRHVVSLLLFLWLFLSRNFKMDGFLRVLLIFLFCYGLSSVITGYTEVFFNKLLGTYCSCIALYCATKVMILKFNSANWIVGTILIIAILDAIVTIGQFFNIAIAKDITDFLGVNNTLEYEWESYERNAGAILGSTASGLLGSVLNGYFLSAATIIALYNKNGTASIKNWILCLFLLVATFLSQERTGFYAAVLGIIGYVMISLKNRPSSFYIYIIIFLAIVFFGGNFLDIINIENTRYGILGNDLGGRRELSASSWNYVLSNPLGGAMEFFASGNREPHNFIANAILYGGLIGGTIIIGYIIYQLVICLKILFERFKFKKYGLLTCVFALSYIIYTINSAFHNPSLPTGSEMFYVWWGCIAALSYIDTTQVKYNIRVG